MMERVAGTLTVYIVDMRAHPATWDVRLPCRGDRDFFQVSISLNYQVEDPGRMIEEQIEDTEGLIARTLEPLLRKQSRQFALNKYEDLLPLLEAAITSDVFGSLGLRLNRPVDVTIRLDAAAHDRIKQLDDLERATRVSQQEVHEIKLPSKESAYNFEVHATVTYRVAAVDQLPTDTLAEAEKRLWPQVESTLRRVSRNFGVDQVSEAEQEIQKALADRSLKGHGLEILSVQVAIDLDEHARRRAEELAQLRHEAKVAQLRDQAAALQQERTIRMREDALTFYRPLIEGGQKELLVLMLSNNPKDAQQILSYLDEKEQGQLELKLNLLKVMAERGGLWEGPAEQAAQALLDSLMILVERGSVLQSPQEQQQLIEGREEDSDTGEGSEAGNASDDANSSIVDDADDEGDIGDDVTNQPGE